jgi:hypothetical protein
VGMVATSTWVNRGIDLVSTKENAV